MWNKIMNRDMNQRINDLEAIVQHDRFLFRRYKDEERTQERKQERTIKLLKQKVQALESYLSVNLVYPSELPVYESKKVEQVKE